MDLGFEVKRFPRLSFTLKWDTGCRASPKTFGARRSAFTVRRCSLRRGQPDRSLARSAWEASLKA